MREIELLYITLEPERGRLQKLEIDPAGLSRSVVDFRDFTYPTSHYWAKTGITVGQNTGEFPIARIFCVRHNQEQIVRIIRGIPHVTSSSVPEIIEDFKRAMAQVGPDGCQRVLDGIRVGRWPVLSGPFVRDGIGEPLVEALPKKERDWVIRQSAGWSMFGDQCYNDVMSAWKRAGVKNIDLELGGHPRGLIFIPRREIVRVLSEIVEGKHKKVGRYTCPVCGKDDIKSKSGLTLHVKKCMNEQQTH